MGLALMVGARNQSLTGYGNNYLATLQGTQQVTNAEANTQMPATEAMTFSRLHGYISDGGGDAANTFTFRKNGSNVNQNISRTGVGAMSPSGSTDVLAANDLFNVHVSEASTVNPLTTFLACNVEFSSGHGNVHASTAWQPSFTTASVTRYIPLAGALNGGGVTTAADAQVKSRAYTSWEAFFVRVVANGRQTLTTFRNNINGSDGSFQVDFAADATGLVVDTSPTDSLADGDLLCASITTGTGTETISPSICGGTFKSTSGKSQAWAGAGSGFTRSASGTPTSFPIGGALATPTGNSETANRVTPGFAARCSHVFANVSANTYSGNSFVRLLKNSSIVISTQIGAGATGIIENTTDTNDIDTDDYLTMELDDGTANSATFRTIGFLFSPLATLVIADDAQAQTVDNVVLSVGGARPALIGGKLTNSLLLKGLAQ